MAQTLEAVNINPVGELTGVNVLDGNPKQLGFGTSNPSSHSDKTHQPSGPGEIKRLSSLEKAQKRESSQAPTKAGGPSSVSSVEVKKTRSEVRSEVKDASKSELHISDELQPNDSASNIIRGERNSRQQQQSRDGGHNKENSFVRNVRKEAGKLDPLATAALSREGGSRSRRKMKKGIFVSYSPDAGFVERRFVTETVKQLKENNLSDDVWFDKDEKNTDSPCWFSLRMEAVERCRAALLILSESYFTCPVSIYEGKALLERRRQDPNSVKLFLVLYSISEETEIPKIYTHLLNDMIDLTKEEHIKKSLAEKTSVVIGSCMVELEKIATIHAPPPPYTPSDTEFTGEYKRKKICQWSVNDLQEWLFKLGIKEFYRQSLAEAMVDGFLLMAMTDADMVQQLGIDSRVVRKKIMQQILVTLDKEHKLPDNWHLRARTQRPRPNCVYLVYDPADVRLAQSLKLDLTKKGLQVIQHQKLGQSKEEFLQLNGPQMATASFVLIVLTEAAVGSPFVFHEVLFADWLGKKLVTAMFRNTWTGLRVSMKAVLGECPAVDFESKMYHESMDVLEHHIKPLRTIPGVVLEQAYLHKMADGLRPLAQLASGQHASTDFVVEADPPPKVFISYQWDMQSRVEDIRRVMEANTISCWADISPTMSSPGGSGGPGPAPPPTAVQRGHSSLSSRSSGQSTSTLDGASESLQLQIQRNMKAASVVLSCITPKYMQSDNCVKDLTLADTLHKPIIPVMLRFCPWPPEGAPAQVRKILVKHTPVDLSNEKLFKQNIHTLLEKVRKILGQK